MKVLIIVVGSWRAENGFCGYQFSVWYHCHWWPGNYIWWVLGCIHLIYYLPLVLVTSGDSCSWSCVSLSVWAHMSIIASTNFWIRGMMMGYDVWLIPISFKLFFILSGIQDAQTKMSVSNTGSYDKVYTVSGTAATYILVVPFSPMFAHLIYIGL